MKEYSDPQLSERQLESLLQVRAEQGDSSFAIAWALTKLARAQERTADALDRLGMNRHCGSPEAPGTTEFIGMEMKRLADATQAVADAIGSRE